MLPTIIIHNSISLDGSLTNFIVNMNLHYHIAGTYKPDAHLIGSNTIKYGIELYGSKHTEEEKDFQKPTRNANLPFWIIIDSKGSLEGLLHEVRRFEYCKDIVLLISEKTPPSYIKYLQKRKYEYQCIGKDHVDLKSALDLMNKKYHAKTIITDCGRILSNLLINQGLIKEISLLIHPTIVGENRYSMFEEIKDSVKLKQIKCEPLEDGLIWIVCQIIKKKSELKTI